MTLKFASRVSNLNFVGILLIAFSNMCSFHPSEFCCLLGVISGACLCKCFFGCYLLYCDILHVVMIGSLHGLEVTRIAMSRQRPSRMMSSAR